MDVWPRPSETEPKPDESQRNSFPRSFLGNAYGDRWGEDRWGRTDRWGHVPRQTGGDTYPGTDGDTYGTDGDTYGTDGRNRWGHLR